MRRSLLTSLLCISIMLYASLTLASTPEDAQKVLQASVERIVGHIKNPEYKDVSKRSALNALIEKEVYATFDFEEFSKRTVGAFWKNFSPKQQKDFTEAFAALLFATYLDRVDGYSGEVVAYDGIVSNSKGTRVEVRTTLTTKGNAKIPMNYRMLPKGGTWRVYDVLVEGISLVKNYRTQFNDALQSGSPEELIKRVHERAAVVAKGSYEN